MQLPIERFGTIHDLTAAVSWSPAQLAAEVERRAHKLAGIGPGAIIALTHGGTAAFFADLFAVWSTGAAAACLDPALTPSERDNVITFCKAAAVLSEDDVAITSQSAAQRASDGATLILFTSGTTGAPKGVVLSAHALRARLHLNRTEIGDDTLARTLVTLPTHFGHGLIGNALTPLVAGGDIVLVPRGLSLAQQLGALIGEHEITFMSSVPSLWQMALRLSPRPNKQTLRRVHIGSAPLSAATWSRIQEWCACPVVNCYGITETANWIAGASTADHPPSDGFVGKPWGGKAGVVGADDKVQATGAGEIAIQSPALMTGYLHRLDLTHAVLTQIIVEQEGRAGGQTLLPVPFLRQLIRFYDDAIGKMVPSYLQFSLESLVKEQERLREQFAPMFQQNPFGAAAFEALQQQTRKNVAMFEQAMTMWKPFTAGIPGIPGIPGMPASAEGSGTDIAAAGDAKPAATGNDLAELKAEFARMQAKIEKLSKSKD